MNIGGALFFICLDQYLSNLLVTVLQFQEERPVFLREHANKMYSVSAYFWTKTIAQLPPIILTTILTSIIVYFGIGLTITVGKFFNFLLILFLLSFSAIATGTLISSLYANAESACLAAPIFVMPYAILGGFFVNSQEIMVWIKWI